MSGKTGVWVNYVTQDIFDIFEHETWLRSGDNAKKLGIADWAINEFKNYVPQKDRLKFLLSLIDKFPIIRARQHGTFATFEFSSYEVEKPLAAIAKTAEHFGFGDFSGMIIVNFANREEISVNYGEFKEKYQDADELKKLNESFDMIRLTPGLSDIFKDKVICEGKDFKILLRPDDCDQVWDSLMNSKLFDEFQVF